MCIQHLTFCTCCNSFLVSHAESCRNLSCTRMIPRVTNEVDSCNSHQQQVSRPDPATVIDDMTDAFFNLNVSKVEEEKHQQLASTPKPRLSEASKHPKREPILWIPPLPVEKSNGSLASSSAERKFLSSKQKMSKPGTSKPSTTSIFGLSGSYPFTDLTIDAFLNSYPISREGSGRGGTRKELNTRIEIDFLETAALTRKLKAKQVELDQLQTSFHHLEACNNALKFKENAMERQVARLTEELRIRQIEECEAMKAQATGYEQRIWQLESLLHDQNVKAEAQDTAHRNKAFKYGLEKGIMKEKISKLEARVAKLEKR